MSNSIAGSGGNSTSSVKSFFKNVGSATAKFGKHLIICVESFGRYSYFFIRKIVCRPSEDARSLKEREASIENDKKAKILIMEMGENTLDTEDSRRENAIDRYKKTFEYRFNELKRNLKFFFTNDTVRHVAKFLLFAAGTALFIVGMFFPPVSAIAALTILGIAVTRFIFKAVHIIKQAKDESKMHGNKLIIAAKTMFKLLVASAEIPAFFLGGPLASLIMQLISGAILGIMKEYDDRKIDERVKKELNQPDSYGISDEEDVDDEEENEIELKTGDRKGEEQDVQSSTNSNTSSKGNLTNDMHINYA